MTRATPRDDLVAHDPEDCVCGPLLIPVVGGDGARSQIEIHRRLDGRENEPLPTDSTGTSS